MLQATTMACIDLLCMLGRAISPSLILVTYATLNIGKIFLDLDIVDRQVQMVYLLYC